MSNIEIVLAITIIIAAFAGYYMQERDDD